MQRYVVIPALQQPNPSAPSLDASISYWPDGFNIYDNQEKCRLVRIYMERAEAAADCDVLNGQLYSQGLGAAT